MKTRSKLRTISQSVSAAVFLLLFFFAVYPLAQKIPFDIFLRLDPLIALGAAAGLRELSAWMLPALVTIAVTIIAGRLFCSYFCPLGGAIDLADAAVSSSRKATSKRRKNSASTPEADPTTVTGGGISFANDGGSELDSRVGRAGEYAEDRIDITNEPAGLKGAGDRGATAGSDRNPAKEDAVRGKQPGFRSNGSDRREASGLRRLRSVKFGLLTAILVSAFFGSGLLLLFDPISFLTRSAATILHPLAAFLANGMLDISRPLMEVAGLFGLARTSFIQPVYIGAPVFMLLFAVVLGAAVLSKRFWCRYLCPLGALLGLFSLAAPLRRRVTEECNSCGFCRKVCPMDAIGEDPKRTSFAECIGCRSCARACPLGGISFSPGTSGASTGNQPPVDAGRRTLLLGAGSALSLVFLARTGAARRLRSSRLIRPPGSLPEEKFLAACARCGECMKACVTNTLQPSIFEAGLEGLWTPRHEMRLAGCEQECNVCGRVCPTGAIRSLPMEEKKAARIGTAVIRRELCVAWEHHMLCLKCDEACPYNAIVFKMVEGEKRPFVDETKCNGCGICEQVCPVLGDAAVFVSPTGEIRLDKGSYIAEAEKTRKESESREEKDTLEETTPTSNAPSGPNDSGGKPDPPGAAYENNSGYDAAIGEDELPPGFLP